MEQNVQPAKGKLGILVPGMGAVATTFIAGVEAVKKGIAQPIGSLTQMSNIRIGKRTEISRTENCGQQRRLCYDLRPGLC